MKLIKPYIPYSGNKQRISGQIIHLMEEKHKNTNTFIDLFGGGGSMSFALLSKGYKVAYNEINKGYYSLLLFLKQRREFCIKNNISFDLPKKFYKFVSREDYDKITQLNDNQLSFEEIVYKYYVLSLYTFNNLQITKKSSGYLYAINKSAANYCLHQAIVYKNKEILQILKNSFSTLGILTELLDCCLQPNIQQAIYEAQINLIILEFIQEQITKHPDRYNILKLLQEKYKQNKNFFKTTTQAELCKMFLINQKELPVFSKLSCSDCIEKTYLSCDHLQRLLHIQAILKLPLENLELYNLDYASFPFEKYSNFVIYADPPYYNTKGYTNNNKDTDFDFSRFSSWCYNCQYPLFVSEITNPNQYKLCSIWEHKIKDNVSAYKTRKEQLFWNGR